jgi:Ni/Fe-hydrogenase 1 B-type cytochrome subunit
MKIINLLSLLRKGKKFRHSGTARLLHWVYAPSVIVLAWSGLNINLARPFGFKNMMTARKTHFTVQYFLLFAYLARVLYGIQKKNHRELFPSRRTLADLPGFLKYELFLGGKKSEFPKYNPGQKVLFLCLTLLILFQLITGHALYNANSWQKTVKMAGGLNPLRKGHFLTALSILVLFLGHFYLALTHGPKKLKSIFTGYE